jgi:2-octaprenyl-6-methoxyphenol hydroxylase
MSPESVNTEPVAAEYDVIISGGGLVGASLAVALANLPLKIALIEAVPPEDSDSSSFDERSIALSRTSKTILTTLGLWPEIDAAAWPINHIHVSEKGRFGTAVIDAGEQGIDHLGHVVKSRVLGKILWQQLMASEAIDVYCPARAGNAALSDSGISVGLQQMSPQRIGGSLLVVADGARSALREQLGVGAEHKAYEQSAIIGNVSIDKQHFGHTAYERFTPEGPLALLPGADGVYTFVLTRKPDDVEATLALADDEFLRVLQTLFGHRVGIFRTVGQRYAYPLYLSTAAAVTSERAVIIGNAAHGLHPVAGQGFNLGLRDAAALAELIGEAVAASTPKDARATLSAQISHIQTEYREWRSTDQRNVVAFTDGLISLFGKPGSAFGVVRGLSLLGFDMLPLAKRSLATYAMGQGGRLSMLARGIRPKAAPSEGNSA